MFPTLEVQNGMDSSEDVTDTLETIASHMTTQLMK